MFSCDEDHFIVDLSLQVPITVVWVLRRFMAGM